MNPHEYRRFIQELDQKDWEFDLESYDRSKKILLVCSEGFKDYLNNRMLKIREKYKDKPMSLRALEN